MKLPAKKGQKSGREDELEKSLGPSDQDTTKISAAQLAEVLAKVDGKRRAQSQPPGDPKDRLAAVERPVSENHVVNSTSAVAPSSGQLLAAQPVEAVVPLATDEPPAMQDAERTSEADGAEIAALQLIEKGRQRAWLLAIGLLCAVSFVTFVFLQFLR